MSTPGSTTNPPTEHKCCYVVCDIAALQKLDEKGRRMVTYAPSDRPADAVISDVTQGDSSSTPHR